MCSDCENTGRLKQESKTTKNFFIVIFLVIIAFILGDK